MLTMKVGLMKKIERIGVMNKLIDDVLKQIKKDVESGDMTAIEELISEVSQKNLKGFLSEYPDD